MPECKIIAIDLAKNVFEVGLANPAFRIIDRKRLNRSGLHKLLNKQQPAVVVMEACGSAHHWARVAEAGGHGTRIIPAQYVRPYRRRNKTDRNDVEALIEAHRCEGIHGVPVRSVEQQQIQQLHRLREQWKKTRTARINFLRGGLRELGVFVAAGAGRGLRQIVEVLDGDTLPPPLRASYAHVVAEIRRLDTDIDDVERQLLALTAHSEPVQRLQQIQGIGLLTSTALVAAAGSPDHFRSARRFAAWLGLTPREYSSGNRRYLGRISKQGDVYLRTLLIHGARSVLIHARRRHKAGQPLNRLQRWAVQLHARVGHNKAAVGVANKLARIAWATWKHQRDYDGDFALKLAA